MYAGVVQLIFFTLSCKRIGALEHFSATSHMQALLKTHDLVVQRVELYLKVQEGRLRTLKRYLRLFRQDQENMKRDDRFLYNPINAYSLIHRLTEDLRVIKDGFNGELTIPKDLVLPVDEDLKGAALGIRRLQKTYDLNVTELADGIIRGTFSHDKKLFEAKTSPMTLSAIFQLGQILYKEGHFENALDWLHEALNRDRADPYTGDASSIIEYIRLAYHQIRDFKTAMEWTKVLIRLRPSQPDLYESMVLYHNHFKKSDIEKDQDQTFPALPEGLEIEDALIEEFKDLCRGEISIPEDKRKHLNCFYKKGPSPLLLLAPVKAELLHKDPDVFMFYDVISDSEIKYVQNMSLTQLERAGILHDKGTVRTSYARISKTGWLTDDVSPTIERLTVRVSDFTDLSMDTAESLQVANYGIGGHYTGHYDFLDEKLGDWDSDRIATVLYYMADVEQGGATVFIHFNLTVFPVKNAAIYWMNLLPSGQPDYRTFHAACPVLVGSKWACNKWIHQEGQELIKPCDLKNQENAYLNYEIRREESTTMEAPRYFRTHEK